MSFGPGTLVARRSQTRSPFLVGEVVGPVMAGSVHRTSSRGVFTVYVRWSGSTRLDRCFVQDLRPVSALELLARLPYDPTSPARL